MKTLSNFVAEHHAEQFGPVPLDRLCTKLYEETGELAGGIIRHLEQRNGADWLPHIRRELGDVLTVLHVIADRLGLDLVDAAEDAAEYFITREFNNISKYEP